MENIRDIIRLLNNDTEVKYCALATVTSVDKSANTCDVQPLDSTAELVEVRLQAQQGKGLVMYPVVGSVVVVSFFSKDDAYVSLVSDVELFDIRTQNESLKAVIADLCSAIKTLTVTTPMGPSGTPINFAQFDSITNRLNNLFK